MRFVDLPDYAIHKVISFLAERELQYLYRFYWTLAEQVAGTVDTGSDSGSEPDSRDPSKLPLRPPLPVYFTITQNSSILARVIRDRRLSDAPSNTSS